jgi:hypothetical protein
MTKVNISRMSEEQIDRKIEDIEGDLVGYRQDFERAQAMYADEPTRAHGDYLRETKRDLRWCENKLKALRAVRGLKGGN